MRPARSAGAGAIAAGLGGAGLTLVALAIGCAPLLVAGLGFVGLAAAAPLLVLPAARRVRVERHLARTRVIEGEVVEARLTIDRGALPLVRVELDDPLGGAPEPVPPGRRSEVVLRAGAPRRGRHLLPPAAVGLSDPLGLLRVTRAGGQPDELLVLPRLEPVQWGGAGPGGTRLGSEAGAGGGAEPFGAGEIDGLRPYRTGTPASRVHWAALARGAGLLERRVRPTGEGWPVVALDTRGAAGPEDLDAAVRAAASLATELARRGGVRLVLPGDRQASAIGPDLAAWPSAHARLALVGGTAARPSLSAAGSGERLFFVCAGAGPAAAAAGSRQVIVVLPAGVPGPRSSPVLSVGGCHGYDVSRRGGVRAAA